MNIKMNGKIKKILFDSKEKEFGININNMSELEYIHINANSNGFYCYNYDNKLLKLLNSNLQKLTIIDKIFLIRDTKAFATKSIFPLTHNYILFDGWACKYIIKGNKLKMQLNNY